jgi:CubicO group peptidase (beta-lactamase class C family)
MLNRPTSLAFLVLAATTTARAQSARLDSIARATLAREGVAGASVLVEQGGRILLHQGYGWADVGLEAAAKPETVYHIVGPMLPFTGVAVMQLVEQRALALDDGLDKFVPEFPLQGRKVTIRQLLAHTSGIVDYHYLGDPIDATSRIPKGLDEVMALYAGKALVNEPGTKWDWSISGFQLLVTVVERVTHQRFPDYMAEHVFAPAGLTSTTYCDDQTLVQGLSHAYRRFDTRWVEARENDMAYNSDLRFCSTVSDLHRLWQALRAGKLIRPETFQLMATPEGPGARQNPADPMMQYGLALSLNHEEQHKRIGQHGSLFGYSGSLYQFPADSLTVVVLTNTEGQNAYAIARALARDLLGLAPLPVAPRPAPRVLADEPVSPGEMGRVDGTYLLKVERLSPELHDSYAQYVRTFRVFDQNGHLLIQRLGEGPEQLLKQSDGTFAIRSAPRARLSFTLSGGKATRMRLDPDGPGLLLSGSRVGPGDPATFHQQGREQPGR